MGADTPFRALGTTCLIVTQGGPSSLGARLRARLDDLEDRWSRFRPHSELRGLNEGPRGVPAPVSPDTALLVERAAAAWALTSGRFDPTVHDAVVAAGYDASFETIATVERRHEVAPAPGPSPGCAGIVVDRASGTVVLPPGVSLDPGAIGKGLAGDLLAEEALAGGAAGVLVDLGGDVRVRGDGPMDDHWVIDVEHPLDASRPLLHLALRDVAVATSSRLRRRWVVDGRPRHHVIDPATGAPSATPVVAATVLAPQGWTAEALATSVMVAGGLDGLAGAPPASALVVDEAGRVQATADLEELLT